MVIIMSLMVEYEQQNIARTQRHIHVPMALKKKYRLCRRQCYKILKPKIPTSSTSLSTYIYKNFIFRFIINVKSILFMRQKGTVAPHISNFCFMRCVSLHKRLCVENHCTNGNFTFVRRCFYAA